MQHRAHAQIAALLDNDKILTEREAHAGRDAGSGGGQRTVHVHGQHIGTHEVTDRAAAEQIATELFQENVVQLMAADHADRRAGLAHHGDREAVAELGLQETVGHRVNGIRGVKDGNGNSKGAQRGHDDS